jgi:acetyl esterase/lipase
MSLELRVRALGLLLAQVSGPVASMPPERRAALREQRAPGVLRTSLNGKRALGVASVDVAVAGESGPVPAHVYRPVTGSSSWQLPLVVAFHGGGFMFGNLDSADWLCSRLAARTPAVVVSGTYRLAPEHPAPAALQDAFAVTRWAAHHSKALAGGRAPLAVLGESSGGTLAASVALMARDTNSFPITQQVLVYPITDLSLSSPSLEELPDQPILNAADVRSYVAASWVRLADPPTRTCHPCTPRTTRDCRRQSSSARVTTRCVTTAGGTPSSCGRAGSRWSSTSSPTRRTASSASPRSVGSRSRPWTCCWLSSAEDSSLPDHVVSLVQKPRHATQPLPSTTTEKPSVSPPRRRMARGP